MRCILCDRCGKIVEDQQKIKHVTYTRPLNTTNCPTRGDDRAMNDLIWTKEICPSCAETFEEFMAFQPDKSDETPDSPEDSG